MLVLTRRIGETLVIDGDIRVTVVSVQGDKVRLGIAAPTTVPIHREEIQERREQASIPKGYASPPDPLEVTPPPRWQTLRGLEPLSDKNTERAADERR